MTPEERLYQYLLNHGKYAYHTPEEIAEICDIPVSDVADVIRRAVNKQIIRYWKRTDFPGAWGFKAITNSNSKASIESRNTSNVSEYPRVTPTRIEQPIEYLEGLKVQPPGRPHRLTFTYDQYLSTTDTDFLRSYAQKKHDKNWCTGYGDAFKYQISPRGRLRLYLDKDYVTGLISFAQFMDRNHCSLFGNFDYEALNSKGCWSAKVGFPASGDIKRYETTRIRLRLANSQVKVFVGIDKSLPNSYEFDVKVTGADTPNTAQEIALRFAVPTALVQDIVKIKQRLGIIDETTEPKGDLYK